MKLIIFYLLIAQQQWTPTLTGASSVDFNVGQSSIKQNNQQQRSKHFFCHLIHQRLFIYLDFPQKNQVFNNQQQLSK